MSAFIVQPETMTRAVNAIDYSRRGSWKPRALGGFNPTESLETMPTPTELGRRLYTLNQEAIRQRYPGDDEFAEIPTDYEHSQVVFSYDGHAKPPLDLMVDAYKGLCCLIYQCSEGDVPETETFRLLIDARHNLADAIVSALPQYEMASWD